LSGNSHITALSTQGAGSSTPHPFNIWDAVAAELKQIFDKNKEAFLGEGLMKVMASRRAEYADYLVNTFPADVDMIDSGAYPRTLDDQRINNFHIHIVILAPHSANNIRLPAWQSRIKEFLAQVRDGSDKNDGTFRFANDPLWMRAAGEPSAAWDMFSMEAEKGM
jgi:hypothetical protein